MTKNKYGYKEIREFDCDGIRNLCNIYNWYTLGTKEEYNKLLSLKILGPKAEVGITKGDIELITQDIIEHSEIEEGYAFEDIAFIVLQATHTYFKPIVKNYGKVVYLVVVNTCEDDYGLNLNIFFQQWIGQKQKKLNVN